MSRTSEPEMGEASGALMSVLREDARRAGGYRDGDDPWPTLETLSRTLFAEAAGALEALGDSEREAIARAGRRALLAVGPARASGRGAGAQDDAEGAEGAESDDDDAADAIALARAGLAVLGGEALAKARGPRDAMHAPDGRLVRAARGELDGFSMGALALHVARCDGCAARLGVLRADHAARAAGEAAPATPMRVAARSAVPMRRPTDGRVVVTLEDPAVELVLFDEGGVRSLAVYAEQPVSVRLVAPGIETIDMLTGYWLGRIDAEVPTIATIEAELHHDERVTRVTIAL